MSLVFGSGGSLAGAIARTVPVSTLTWQAPKLVKAALSGSAVSDPALSVSGRTVALPDIIGSGGVYAFDLDQTGADGATVSVPVTLTGDSNVLTDFDWALDFKSKSYRSGTTVAPSPSGLPGYSFGARGVASYEAVDDGVMRSIPAGAPPIVTGVGYYPRGARTNLLLNAGGATGLVTQTVTVSATAHNLSFVGTGSVTLSGAATAKLAGAGANKRVGLTFTPTAGSLTLTVKGDVRFANLIATSAPFRALPSVVTAGAAATLPAADMRFSEPIPADGDWICWVVVDFKAAAGAIERLLAVTSGTTANRMLIGRSATGSLELVAQSNSDTTSVYAMGVSQTTPGKVAMLFGRRGGVFVMGARNSAGVTVVTANGPRAYPLALSWIDIGSQLAANYADSPISFVGFKAGTFSNADMQAILTAATDATPAITWRGSETPSDTFAAGGVQYAQITDGDGWTYRVAEPVTQPVAAALTTSAAVSDKAVIEICYGQSQAGYSGTSNASLLTTQRFPHHCLEFTAGRSNAAGVPTDPATLVDFMPANNSPATPPMVGVLSTFARRLLDMRDGRSRSHFTRADWYGGQPLETFIRGTVTYNSLLTSITAARSIFAAKYGQDSEAFINFMQGENRSTDLAAYPAMLTQLFNDLRDDVAAITGAMPNILFWQTNAGDTSTGSYSEAVAKYHRQVMDAFAATDVVMAGPMYHLPMSDDIHANELGRMMQGELSALVKKLIDTTGNFRPLAPAAGATATRTGAVITLNLVAPTGGGAIALDADWLGAIAAGTANAGFTFTDDSGSPPAISSVAVTGAAQLQITLAAAPTGGNQKLRYGMDAADVTDDGWASCRGLVYSSSGIASLFAEAGYAVPAQIRHYLIRCEVPVA